MTSDVKSLAQAVWLRREGNYAVVLVETGDGWREIIRESLAGWPEVTFSHIKEADPLETIGEWSR